jgi:deoxypyrimidine-specific 5' nucleotidase type C protein (NT5C)
VAALDLDGVLAAYPEHWIGWLEENSLRMPERDVSKFSLVTGVENIDRESYTQLKHAYRSSGKELDVPTLPGAAEFTRSLKHMGYQIVIVSARPVERYKRLYSDSIRWLRKHGVQYDAVLWDSNKEDRIIRDLPVVNFVLDDDPQNVERLVKAGINAYLFDRPYNRQAVGLPRVESYEQLLNMEKVTA